MRAKDYKDKKPRLIVEEFFKGQTSARGAVFTRWGSVYTRMIMKGEGVWNPKKKILTLQEEIHYETGENHHRTLIIRKESEFRYKVESSEIVGTGEIESYGNVLHWNYKLKERSRMAWGIAASFDDWMFLLEDGYILNRIWARKFGIRAGDVVLSINKSKS